MQLLAAAQFAKPFCCSSKARCRTSGGIALQLEPEDILHHGMQVLVYNTNTFSQSQGSGAAFRCYVEHEVNGLSIESSQAWIK